MQMDSKFQHPSIQLFMMETKTQCRCGDDLSVEAQISQSSRSDGDGETCAMEEREDTGEKTGDGIKAVELEKGKIDDWEIRRYGSMAARLLRDVKIT